MFTYNPRKKTYEQLDETLVGADRWDLLGNIISEMSLPEGENPKQHWMLIGPRGIGKSHLLTLLYYKVKNNPDLKKLWIPVLFPEELRMTGNLAKFLERSVHETILELQINDPKTADELKEKIGKTRSVPVEEREDYIFSILSWINQSTGKFLVFITENLQQLLGKKISLVEQKKFRAFLQTSEAVTLIGSATTVFNALHDHSHPFYHFFHIHRLKDLSFDDMKALISTILTDTGRKELAQRVSENEARLKALLSFTGGNPRMAIFLADILKTEVPEEMLDLMDGILDELTPYFETIFKDLPHYLEETINTLAAFEPAQSPKEIAAHLESQSTTIRNYLKQLKDNDYVRIAFSQGRSNYYCLNEYLYRIWFQMRDSGHREETRWLLELLLMLYSPTTIIEEKKKVNKVHQGRVEHSETYTKLITQAADFMESNPEFCKTIERCVASAYVEEKLEKKEENELYTQIYELIDNEDYGKAIEALESYLKGNPDSDWAYEMWGWCLAEENFFEQAIEKYKKAADINPESINAYGNWGMCLLELGRIEQAIEKLEKSIEINPSSEESYWYWGACLQKMGHYDQAINKFKKAIEIDPKFGEAYGAWGDCLKNMGRYPDAEKKYKKAITVAPKYKDAYRALGDCFRQQERHEEAIVYFKKTIEIDPMDYNSYELFGDCLLSLGKPLEAEKIYRKVIEINPGMAESYECLGVCCRDMKKYKEAIKQLKKAIEINPKAFVAYGIWGDCLRLQEMYGEAIKYYRKAIEINPKDHAAYRAWGYCLKELGKYSEAEKRYQKAIEINPRIADLYRNLGVCLRYQEKYKYAIKQLKKAIELDPQHYVAYGVWGDCLRNSEQFLEADKKYQKAIAINPHYADAYRAWGCSLAAQKRYEEAIEKHKKAIEYDPDHEMTCNCYTNCLRKQKRFDEAINHFEKYLLKRSDCYVVFDYGNLLLEAGHYEEASKHLAELLKNDTCPKAYLPYGHALAATSQPEGALEAYLSYFKLSSSNYFPDLDLYKIYLEFFQPVLEKLKPGPYIEKLYAPAKVKNISKAQICTILILLGKYEVVGEHIQAALAEKRRKGKVGKDAVELMSFAIKFTIWIELCQGDIYQALRLAELYAESIRSLKTKKEKEGEVTSLALGLMKLQDTMNIDADYTRKIFLFLAEAPDIPFDEVLLKVLTCISEPDSLEAQKFLSEKVIAEVVKELTAKKETKETDCDSCVIACHPIQ